MLRMHACIGQRASLSRTRVRCGVRAASHGVTSQELDGLERAAEHEHVRCRRVLAVREWRGLVHLFALEALAVERCFLCSSITQADTRLHKCI